MKPKISVVLTTFNRLDRLKKAVKAILKQTFKEFELIIVDDCSTDGTEQYIRKLLKKDDRIRYVKRSKNYGQHTRPKNEGLKVATADYVQFADDDNIFLKDHLQVLWKAMEKENVDVVYGDRMLIDETKKFAKDKVIGIRSDFNIHLMAQQNFIDTSDALTKKSALMDIGGWDESLPKFADWNLWVRLAKAGYKFKRVPIIITNYFVHEGCNQFKSKKMPFDPHNCKLYPSKTIIGESKKLKVAVFTLTYNRLESTKKMFSTINNHTNYEFDHFFIDNGSTDGTPEWIEKNIEKGNYILNKKNKGISKASNQAIEHIGDEYDLIMKVDNDAKFLTNKWLESLVDVYEINRMVVLGLYPEGLKDNPGGVPRKSYGYLGKNFIGIAEHLGGIAIIAPKETYKDFRWNEDDFLHGIQDYEYSQHVQKVGYTCMYMENVKVEHMESTENTKEKVTKYDAKKS